MKRKIDLTDFTGVILFSFGLISSSYGILAIIINLSFGHVGIILYTKDVLFDLIFLLLGVLIIRQNRNHNQRKKSETLKNKKRLMK